MIQLATRFFGVLECPEESVITFPSGIPPFVDQQTFVIISSDDSPVVFLQSVTRPQLCFITVPVQAVDPAYHVKIEPFDLEALGLDGEQGGTDTWKYLTILTIPEQGPTTVNLAAPIVINPARNIGVQAVRSDRRYSHAQLLEQAVSQGEPC
jgi:flagellar assembly factor FliW